MDAVKLKAPLPSVEGIRPRDLVVVDIRVNDQANDPAPPAHIADVFDVMRLQAERRGGDFVLTHSQIAMARTYRDLVERHEAGGIKCSSAEASGGGGGGGSADSFTQARLDASRLIGTLRKRVGDGVAMEIRRIRPSHRGTRARISDRALVDQVCIMDQGISAVLRSHGWIVNGKTVAAATKALGAALDRMQGSARAPRPLTLHCGTQPVWPYPEIGG
ncbi:hypothetical protein [Ketogulonicigenium vulgare]|uniref:hypothetical protein n=1 Tax=Ketogulonicigenium vulgare TaxID=92945 RepID=UPI0023586CAA|nr:hypothetical protein [Ketogulonicigenium vulgare]